MHPTPPQGSGLDRTTRSLQAPRVRVRVRLSPSEGASSAPPNLQPPLGTPPNRADGLTAHLPPLQVTWVSDRVGWECVSPRAGLSEANAPGEALGSGVAFAIQPRRGHSPHGDTVTSLPRIRVKGRERPKGLMWHD